MKEFKTIDEKEILYYAWYAVIEKQKRERSILSRVPDSKTAKTRLANLKAQEKEIHDRIVELENK